MLSVMIRIVLPDGRILDIKTTEVEWCEKSRKIKLFNDSQIVAEINIDNCIDIIQDKINNLKGE